MAFEPSREGQLSEDKLKWGYWWLNHKTQVRTWFMIFLGAFGAVLVAYGGFGFLDWYFGSGVRERIQIGRLAAGYTDFKALRQSRIADPLIVESPMIVDAGSDARDVFAYVSNPNMDWWADFEYSFPGTNAPVKKGFVLPGESKYVHAMGLRGETLPSTADLSIENIVWHRVDPHVIRPDYLSWATARLNLTVSDAVFVASVPTDPIALSRVTFRIKNDTAFSYWRVGFFVRLEGKSGTSAVNYVTIAELRAGESREVDATWFGDISKPTKIEVIPDVNIFDDRVYIPPGQ